MLAALLFAVAVSLDGLVVGAAEGMRGIRVPLASLVLVNIVSAGVLSISLGAGRFVTAWCDPGIARALGSVLLISLGAWMLRPRARSVQRPAVHGDRGFMEALAGVPGLLAEPGRADLDLSGVLNPGEALLLGLALAIDALGVGFGAGMVGLAHAFTPILASAVQFAFLAMGLALGRRVKASGLDRRIDKIPGALLIILGLLRLA